jgi:hypothetical protein
MTKHYILNLNPTAKYEWDRCTLRDPITAEYPTLAELVADAIANRPGSYLVAVHIEVSVLEAAAIAANSNSPEILEMPVTLPKLAELAA